MDARTRELLQRAYDLLAAGDTQAHYQLSVEINRHLGANQAEAYVDPMTMRCTEKVMAELANQPRLP